jgi:hypothetical protein
MAFTKTHSYEHATRLFIGDGLKLAPKNKYLYYVSINLGRGAKEFSNILSSITSPTGVSGQTLIQQYQAGMLVKRVDLPKFTLQTKTHNAYNRKNVVQTGIMYEPLQITFHDDSADVVNHLWNDYYTYYFRDSDHNAVSYQQYHLNKALYAQRSTDKWGFSIRNRSVEPFIRNIQIFSLHNKKFTEYLLINPVISSWRHGEHDSVAGAEIMDNSMTVMFETVKYRSGSVNPVDVNGFGTLHYDNFNSPLGGGAGQQLLDATVNSLLGGGDWARPEGQESTPNLFQQVSNIVTAGRALGGMNLGSIAATSIGAFGGSAIKQIGSGIKIPTLGDALKINTSSLSIPGTAPASNSGIPGIVASSSLPGTTAAPATFPGVTAQASLPSAPAVFPGVTAQASPFASPGFSSTTTLAGQSSSVIPGPSLASASTNSQLQKSATDLFNRGII